MKNANLLSNIIKNTDDFFIERAMHYTCIAPLFGQNHRHDNKFHIAYILTGKSKIRINNEYHTIGNSDLIFIPSKTSHCSIGDEKTFYDLIEIHFIAKTHRCNLSLPRIPFVLNINNTAAIVSALERCISAYLIDPGPDNLLGKLYLIEALILAEQEKKIITSVPHTTDLTLKINQAKEYLCQSYNKELSVETVADLVGMSPSYFACSFKKIVGISPIEFLIQTRLYHAKNLLINSTFSIGQIADICGFYSSQYLARIFQQREKTTPSHYRKHVEKN